MRLFRAIPYLALGMLALWHFALRWHGLNLPMISDEGEYAYQARLLASGGLPYRDAYNQKPPMVFFLYRLGTCLGENPMGPRLLALGFSWITLLLLYLLTPKNWRMGSRLAAPAVFAVLSTAPIGDMGFAANTEIFLCGFLTFSAWALKASWQNHAWRMTLLMTSGLGVGAALMTKQTTIWAALAFWFLAARRGIGSWNFRAASAYGVGVLAPAVFFLAYFAIRGGISSFLEQAYLRNVDYAGILAHPKVLGAQLAWLIKKLIPLFLIGDWPVHALALLGLAKTRLNRNSLWEILITLWLGAGLIGIATGLYFFPHYFLQAYPPLALAAALGAQKLSQKRSHLAAAALVVISLYPVLARGRTYFLEPTERVAKILLYPNPLFEARRVGQYIREHSTPEDRIYVFGSEPQIYVYAERWAATEHIFVYPLTLFPRDDTAARKELVRLHAVEPKFIVYVDLPASTLIATESGDMFREGIQKLIESRYRLAGKESDLYIFERI